MINRDLVSKLAIFCLALFYFLASVGGTKLGLFFDWIGWTSFIQFLNVYRDYIVSLLLGLVIFRWIRFKWCLVFSFVCFLLFYFKIIPRIVL